MSTLVLLGATAVAAKPHKEAKDEWIPVVFSIVVGLVGVCLLFVGQRMFKTFLGVMAFILAGGASGYVMVYDIEPPLDTWVSILIGGAIGLAASMVALIGAAIGLILFAGVAGAVVVAMPIRLAVPSLDPVARIIVIVLGGVLFMLFTAWAVHRCQPPSLDNDDLGDRNAARRQAIRVWL